MKNSHLKETFKKSNVEIHLVESINDQFFVRLGMKGKYYIKMEMSFWLQLSFSCFTSCKNRIAKNVNGGRSKN